MITSEREKPITEIARRENIRRACSVVSIAALLLVVNCPGCASFSVNHGVFSPAAVRAGEWWRLLTYAVVHVSPYHLALDGLAFILLFVSLRASIGGRWMQTLTCVAASAAGAWLFSPEVNRLGLCGLSGAAHGMMMLSGLESLKSKDVPTRWFGGMTSIGIALKSAWEVANHRAVFADFHLGNVGIPIPGCHLGGVLGGLACFGVASAVLRLRHHTSRHALKSWTAVVPG
jgi:rhomboid family GlyGly-CTERM serine protease